MKNVMLDLETFGNTSNSVIIQIGACYFDITTGKIGKKFLVNVNPEDCEQYGLECNSSTVQWWMQQDKKVIDTLFSNQISLTEALRSFENFLLNTEAIWCHASFDTPIIMNAFKKCNLKFPLNYKVWKDLRTLEYMAKIDKSQYKRTGNAHNGLDDCIFQVNYLVAGLQKFSKGEVK